MHEVDLFSRGSVHAAQQHAEVLSDLLFVTPDPAHWLPFRDVYSVNGRPVRDREQRLARLFINQEPDAVDQAGQIAREGFRYNIGSPDRTIANPLLARPTLLRTPDNRNVVTLGRFWIDGASGRVLQSDLETSTGDKVMTIFAYDERLRLDVPVEMRDIAWLNRAAITGTAMYTNFRRFGVATDERFR